MLPTHMCIHWVHSRPMKDAGPADYVLFVNKQAVGVIEYKHGDWNQDAALKFIVQSGDFLLSRHHVSPITCC